MTSLRPVFRSVTTCSETRDTGSNVDRVRSYTPHREGDVSAVVPPHWDILYQFPLHTSKTLPCRIHQPHKLQHRCLLLVAAATV